MAKRAKFTLVHGTLLVNLDLDEYIEIMEKIYQGLGGNKKLQKGKITSLNKKPVLCSSSNFLSYFKRLICCTSS